METNEDKKTLPTAEDIAEMIIVEIIFHKYQGELFAERNALLEAVHEGRKLEARVNGRQ